MASLPAGTSGSRSRISSSGISSSSASRGESRKISGSSRPPRSPGSGDGCGCLATDRMPYGLHLQERGDLPWALPIGPAANDSLDVLCREPLELRRLAVGAGEVERVHVHVPREPGGEL